MGWRGRTASNPAFTPCRPASQTSSSLFTRLRPLIDVASQDFECLMSSIQGIESLNAIRQDNSWDKAAAASARINHQRAHQEGRDGG
jgi:hypothetical protein